MGKYDEISGERLRADLVAFARLLLRLDDEGRLTDAPAHLQRMLGDLRQKLFAYEVQRGSIAHGDSASGESDPDQEQPASDDVSLRNSLRVVRDALRRDEELRREWESGGSDTEPLDG
jgi:hypothetical protein